MILLTITDESNSYENDSFFIVPSWMSREEAIEQADRVILAVKSGKSAIDYDFDTLIAAMQERGFIYPEFATANETW